MEAAQLGVLSYRGEPQSRESMIHDTASSYVHELFNNVWATLEHDGIMLDNKQLIATQEQAAHEFADRLD